MANLVSGSMARIEDVMASNETKIKKIEELYEKDASEIRSLAGSISEIREEIKLLGDNGAKIGEKMESVAAAVGRLEEKNAEILAQLVTDGERCEEDRLKRDEERHDQMKTDFAIKELLLKVEEKMETPSDRPDAPSRFNRRDERGNFSTYPSRGNNARGNTSKGEYVKWDATQDSRDVRFRGSGPGPNGNSLKNVRDQPLPRTVRVDHEDGDRAPKRRRHQSRRETEPDCSTASVDEDDDDEENKGEGQRRGKGPGNGKSSGKGV